MCGRFKKETEGIEIGQITFWESRELILKPKIKQKAAD
jgi:hypothetical protein